MSVVKPVVKILGMFDKLDDIIYEPLHLVCDACRQPLKQLDLHNEKVKAIQEQELAKQLKEFEVDLEIERKRREAELTIEQRRLEEEINQMIMQNDLAGREEMIQLEMKYRKEMANAAAELAQIMANMQVDARSKVLSLYNEKKEEYAATQEKYKLSMFETVKNLKEIFPDGSGDDIIRAEVTTQINAIAQRSADFTKLMNDDMKNVLGIIDDGMKEIIGLATKYFQPAQAGQAALTQEVTKAIEEK